MRLNSQASCEDCESYTYPDSTKGRVCQEQPCAAVEYLTPTGACEDCMGDKPFGLRYIGCYQDVTIPETDANRLSPFDCYNEAVAEGSKYLILQGGNKCIRAGHDVFAKYGAGDYVAAADGECDLDCATDKSLKCGGMHKSSIYERPTTSYHAKAGSCERNVIDDYKLYQKDVRCTTFEDLGDKISIEECTALAKTDAKCKDGEGYFTFGFTQCYCCTTSGATSNPESLPGFDMYQIDLKGYFEQSLCSTKT
jgi:hypothetical protein